MDRSNFLSTLNKTFPLFRIFGFEIRCQWTAILFLFLCLHIQGVLMGSNGTAPLVLALIGFFLLFSIVLVHELGHGFAARSLGLPIRQILLTPVGGLAMLEASPRSPREELIVIIWGPAVHPLMLIVGGPLYYLTSSGSWDAGLYGNAIISQFFWINVILLGFNLLPAFPMDGGRLLRALLARRMNASRATIVAAYVGQVASVIFILVAVTQSHDFWFLLLLIGAMNLIACEKAKIQARHEDPYESHVSDPYGLNYYNPQPGEYGDQSYGSQGEEREAKPGPIKRFFQERASRRVQEQQRQDQDTRERVDHLLEKVTEVGMSGLTAEEQEFLAKASDLYRKPKDS